MSLPKFEQINLAEQPLIAGYYTLGMIERYRPDIELIHLDQWRSTVTYSWLDRRIAQALENKKIVCIVPWEENIIWPPNAEMFETVNKYQHDPVYWITQFVTGTCNPNLKLKVVEIQWWLLNDCLMYHHFRQNHVPRKKYKENYLCMLGRYESHKYALGKQLHLHGLDQSGLITVAYPRDYPQDHTRFSKPCPVPLYPKLNHPLGKTRANTKIDGVWVSGNVENWLALADEFADVPLMINPDTTCNIMQMSEKLIWPMLLGKLFLLYGNHGITKAAQRFYDIDIAGYANLEFDQVVGWTPEHNHQRLITMIEKNRSLIEDCRDIYDHLKPDLEYASHSVVKNFYTFFADQLSQVQ